MWLPKYKTYNLFLEINSKKRCGSFENKELTKENKIAESVLLSPFMNNNSTWQTAHAQALAWAAENRSMQEYFVKNILLNSVTES